MPVTIFKKWKCHGQKSVTGKKRHCARLAGDGLRTERARLAQGGYRGEGFGTERARLTQGGYRGEGFCTERARLGRNALGTERARLAQGDNRG